MVEHDAMTMIRGDKKTQSSAPLGSLEQQLAEGIALVAFSVTRRNRPCLTGGRLWAALVDHVRGEIFSRELETSVLTELYTLVFPSHSLGGQHV